MVSKLQKTKTRISVKPARHQSKPDVLNETTEVTTQFECKNSDSEECQEQTPEETTSTHRL